MQALFSCKELMMLGGNPRTAANSSSSRDGSAPGAVINKTGTLAIVSSESKLPSTTGGLKKVFRPNAETTYNCIARSSLSGRSACINSSL
ncbi:hypothetical protein Mapa_008145 [Marchantia paleacea]|nr:hypothetical protein Mapa_008145 [Marchantia paleacea]